MKRTGSQADHGCAGGQPRRAAALICLDDEQKASLEPLGTDQTILLRSWG